MKSTSQFIKASPQMKNALVMDGFVHVTEQFSLLSRHLKILNIWVDVLPTMIEHNHAKKLNAENIDKLIEQFQANADLLTYQISSNQQCVNKLTAYLKSIKK